VEKFNEARVNGGCNKPEESHIDRDFTSACTIKKWNKIFLNFNKIISINAIPRSVTE